MIYWIIATFTAYFLKGLCGFANTLVFTTIMAFGANNVNISPVELIIGLPSNIILTWRNRQKLDFKMVLPLVIMVILGSIPGALLLKSVNASYVKIFFGGLVMFIGAELFYREKHGSKSRGSKLMFLIVGILSGILCGMFGVGALLAAYLSRVTETGSEFKANLSAVFIADNIFRVILYSTLGLITFPVVKQAVVLIPVMLISLYLGIKFSDILDDKIVKKLVMILLIISGLAMIITNL